MWELIEIFPCSQKLKEQHSSTNLERFLKYRITKHTGASQIRSSK